MTNTKKTFLVLGVLVLGYIGFRYAWHYGTVAYFEYKCERYGGEFIYKTVDNVEGVFQMRLRDPRDYFTRLMKGDIPEDPYGHTNWEARNPQTLFVNPNGTKYHFLETTKPPDPSQPSIISRVSTNIRPTGERYWRYSISDKVDGNDLSVEQTSVLKSQYGFTWSETRTLLDKLFGVRGGQLIVMNLSNRSILGIRRGFFYQNRFSKEMRICPKGKDVNTTYAFVKKVLQPVDSSPKEGSP